MADERVVIKIDVKADTSAIDRVQAKLARLCAQADDCRDTFEGLGKDVDRTGESQRKLGKNSDDLGKRLKSVGREANALSKILKTAYKFAFIGAGIETAALALALSSVNGLLATGRFLVKAYQVVMSGLAKAAAAAGVAIATVAAAQRQYIAAQQAGRYGGFQASSIALRTMTADARLAGLSMKSLNSAFAAASKNAKVTGGTTSAIAGLLDFAAATGDIDKGVASIATLVSLIQKGGVGGAGVAAAAKELGPEFEKAFKEVSRGGKATAQEVLAAFSGGGMATKAGIGGTFSAMQGTLIGQFKSFMSQMQTEFADLGARFITPVQVAFEEIRRIILRTFTQISPLLADFATGGLLGKVVNGIDKISQFLVKLMREYVPKTQDFFGTLSRGWEKLTKGFERFNAYLRKFSDASKIINKFFGQILGAIGGGLKNNFESFAQLLVENKDDFDKFGSSLANLITQIFNLFNAIRTAFMRALPAINSIVNAVARLVEMFASLLRTLTGAGGGFGGAGGLMALMLPMMAGLSFRGGGANAGRMAKGFAKMSGAGKLAVGGGILGAGLLGQTQAGADVMDMLLAGGMAAAFAPTTAAGSFALPAAIAVGGAVGVDKVTDYTYRQGILGTGIGAKNKAVSAGTGAVLGAGVGAAAGSVIPGVGTAIGAGVGAIAGALIGGVIGWSKEGKYKKEARKAAGELVGTFSSSIKEALGNNDMKAAQQWMDNFATEAQTMANNQVKSGTALNAATELWSEKSKELQSAINVMGARFKDLTNITDMSEEQIRDLANTANVDLGNSMMSLQEILAATGIATARFGDDFKYAMTDIYASATASIRQTLQIVQAPDIYAAAGRAFGQKGRAGTVTDEDRAQFFEDIFQQELLMAGGDPIQAYLSMQREYGTALKPGGQFSVMQGGKKGDLYGLADVFFGGNGSAMFSGAMGQLGGGAAGLTAENLISEAARLGIDLGMTKEGLTTALTTMSTTDPTRFASILQATSAGTFLTPQAYAARGGLVGETPEAQLTKLLGSDLTSQFKIQETASKTMKDASAGFKTTVEGTFAAAVDKFAGAVGYMDKGDTSTPRRNFVNMMGAHNRLNSSIAGRRTITSGIRNYGLGSIDSDHAAGRAYDLVGQNLGLYQMGIRSGGGYAEFHGTGAQRHLHVVPGMGDAIGDTSTPYMGGAIAPTSATTNNNSVNVTVNAAPGMDVQALANEVMARIESAQASWAERR